MQDDFLIIVIPLFFKTRRIKQKIIDIYGQDAVFIVMRRNDIFGNNDFLERIVNLPEWSGFLRALCLIRQRICRLNIVSGRTKVDFSDAGGADAGKAISSRSGTVCGF